MVFFVEAIGIHTTCPSGCRLPGADEETMAGYREMESDGRRLDALKQVLEAFNRHDLDAMAGRIAVWIASQTWST